MSLSSYRGIFLLVMFAGASLTGKCRAADDLGVVPTPQRVQWGGPPVRVDGTTRLLIAPDASPETRFAVTELRDALRTKLDLTLVVGDEAEASASANNILIGNPRSSKAVAARMADYGLRLADAVRDQGYVLAVGGKGIVIAATSDAGLLYGTMTLRQMLQARGAGKPLQGVRIHDWPHMTMRGIQDEISYGQVSTMDNFKDMIRFLAEYKMNTMFFYLEDVFRFKHYPTIGIGRGALTRQQVDQLEAFAKSYHVEIIPIFEMLANQGALLMLDEVRPLAEYPGAHSFAVNEATYRFLGNCLDELTAAFDSEYFHAGLDESWDLGFGKTEARVQREGRGPVHAAHYRRLNEMIRSRGKTMIMYADIILNRPEILDLIPKDIVLMDWQYHPAEHYPTLARLGRHSFPIMVLPGMSNWDRIFPNMSGAMINIRNFTLDAMQQNALGSFTSTWGDNGSKNLRELLYSGYAYGAEVTWSPQSTDVGSFSRRYFTVRYGPGTATYFEAVYALLEKWPWWFPLLDYFRHPFLPRKDERPHTEQELYRVGQDARVAEQLVEVLRPLVVHRQGDLDYLTYCARSHQHYVRSQRLVRQLQQFPIKSASPDQVRQGQARLLGEIDTVRNESVALRERFRQLWLRTNLPANLHYAIDDYDRLVKVWDDARRRVARGVFAHDPRPPADWIYHPDGIDGKRQVQHALFRRTIEADPHQLARAAVQVQGDTHVKVYVNGRLLGEQFARRNLSAPVNPQLVRLYDILPHLRQGTNVIAVEARNYGTTSPELEPGGPERCGGFHLYGELVDKDGNVRRLVSDPSWRVSDKPMPDWATVQLDDQHWPTAKRDEHPTVWITYPDFAEQVRGFSDLR